MKRNAPVLKPLASVASLLLALGALTGSAQAQSRWRVGQQVAPLRLPVIDGSRTLELADFRGQKLLLFEFASW